MFSFWCESLVKGNLFWAFFENCINLIFRGSERQHWTAETPLPTKPSLVQIALQSAARPSRSPHYQPRRSSAGSVSVPVVKPCLARDLEQAAFALDRSTTDARATISVDGNAPRAYLFAQVVG